MKRLMPLKEEFLSLTFPKRGERTIPQRATQGSARFGREEGAGANEGIAMAFTRVSTRTARQGRAGEFQ